MCKSSCSASMRDPNAGSYEESGWDGPTAGGGAGVIGAVVECDVTLSVVGGDVLSLLLVTEPPEVVMTTGAGAGGG